MEAGSSTDLHRYKLDIASHLHSPELQQEGPDVAQCLSSDEDGFFYIPDFITEQEEAYLMDKILSSPRPKWRELQARRLQYWGGQLSAKQVLIPETMPDFFTTFPALIERIRDTGAFAGSKHGEPNHCLVNEYEPGQGIMPHEDGGAYFAAVATVSLGSHTLLDIYRYADTLKETGEEEARGATSREQLPRFSILQERRSLLITRGAAYRAFLHGIAERTEDDEGNLKLVANDALLTQPALQTLIKDCKAGSAVSISRDTRLSLTFRDVEKVVPKGLMAMMGKQ